MTGWLLLIIASMLSCLGQLCQKQAALVSADRGGHRRALMWLALALVMLGLGMLVWLGVLQRLPVGIAYPLLSLNIVWITLSARLVWRETITPRHWLGIVLIIAGSLLAGGGA